MTMKAQQELFMRQVVKIEHGLSVREPSAEEFQRSVELLGFAQYFVVKIRTGG